MKRIQAWQAYSAYSRLRAAEFAHLVTHLRESRDEALDCLKHARTMDAVARCQAEVEVLETILRYVDQGEELARKMQQ